MTRDEGFLKYSGNSEGEKEKNGTFVKFDMNPQSDVAYSGSSTELPLDDYSGRYSDGYACDSLEHHGIAGQKWGVRQGPPYPLVAKASRTIHYNVGKMTEKTKSAYQKSRAAAASRKAAKVEAKAAKVQAKAAKKEAKKSKDSNIADVGPKKFAKSKQRISEMSSEELKARIERLKLEEEYRKYLNGGQVQRQNAKRGKSNVEAILDAYGNSTIKKVADTIVLGLVSTGVKMAGDYASTHVQRAHARKQTRDEIIKDAIKNKIAQKREVKNREKEDEARRRKYEDKYYETWAQKKAEADIEEYKKRRNGSGSVHLL